MNGQTSLARAVLILLVAVAACNEGDAIRAWSTAIDTLPNGAIHVVNTPPDEGIRPTWTLEEELRIGSVDEAGPAAFGQVRGLAALEDGRVAVLDGQAQELRVFGPDGRYLATHGRRGSGPGELEGAFGLMRGPEGKLWVPDYRNARMSVFDPEGGFERSYPLQLLTYGFVWRGVMTEAGQVLKPSITLSPSRRPVLRVFDGDMRLVDSIPLPAGPEVDPEDSPGGFLVEASGGGRFFFGVPYYAHRQELLDPRGEIWSTNAGDPSYRIFRWTPGGDTALVLETHRPPVPVTDAERDSLIEDLRERLRELGGARQDWSKIPTTKPAVVSMFVADDGRLWVRAASTDTLLHYDVYERDGRRAGTVLTGLEVWSPVPPVVRGDSFWAVVTDDLDVPYVVRARITPVDGEPAAVAPPPSTPDGPELISFPTEDGGVVYADLYGDGAHGVVLAHGGRFDKGSWRGQATALADAGFRVLAIDFRGRGLSRGGPASGDADEAYHHDVLAAVRYLRGRGAEMASVVGASFGGWAAARAAVAGRPGEIDRLVLLAHSAIEEPERLPGRKLFVAARDDTTGSGARRLDGIRDQYERAPDPKELVVLEGAAHAQFLFETSQGDRLMREIQRFLSEP